MATLIAPTTPGHAPHPGTVLLRRGEGMLLQVLGDQLRVKASMRQTNGAYSMFEVEIPPGSGTPPHVEQRDEELFYVLDGALTLVVDGHTVVATAGDSALIPRGTPHCYRNASDRPVRALVISSPGGVHEPMFEELAALETDDVGEVTRICGRYGVEILPG